MGDQHNEAFGFVSFFPKRLHPAVTVATTACFRVAEHCPCCATLHEQKRKVVNVMKHQALPGHTQSEAERYRSRCAAAGTGAGARGRTAHARSLTPPVLFLALMRSGAGIHSTGMAQGAGDAGPKARRGEYRHRGCPPRFRESRARGGRCSGSDAVGRASCPER